jgi:hypothetical protein
VDAVDRVCAGCWHRHRRVFLIRAFGAIKTHPAPAPSRRSRTSGHALTGGAVFLRSGAGLSLRARRVRDPLRSRSPRLRDRSAHRGAHIGSRPCQTMPGSRAARARLFAWPATRARRRPRSSRS